MIGPTTLMLPLIARVLILAVYDPYMDLAGIDFSKIVIFPPNF